jgi:hypothetical protein
MNGSSVAGSASQSGEIATSATVQLKSPLARRRKGRKPLSALKSAGPAGN